MCGAAVVCYCTCSTAATHGHATTPIHCVSRSVFFVVAGKCDTSPLKCIEVFSRFLSRVCQIVNEPPPLWEVPSNCNNFTAKVFRAGLQKDPDRRASAKELRRKTTKALRAGRCVTCSRIMYFYNNHNKLYL